jgi:hypothetical protein
MKRESQDSTEQEREGDEKRRDEKRRGEKKIEDQDKDKTIKCKRTQYTTKMR